MKNNTLVIKLTIIRYRNANIKNFTTMGNKNYTLTKRDKLYLLSIGYLECDLPWIEKDVNETMRYEHCHNNGKEQAITREQAIKLVGKHRWLSGVARACFHASSARETKGSPSGKTCVYFDNHESFKRANGE